MSTTGQHKDQPNPSQTFLVTTTVGRSPGMFSDNSSVQLTLQRSMENCHINVKILFSSKYKWGAVECYGYEDEIGFESSFSHCMTMGQIDLSLAQISPLYNVFVLRTKWGNARPCYTKCSPQTSSKSIAWEYDRNAESQAPPQTYWIKIFSLNRILIR